jgi:hypothetical protein
MLEAKIIDCCRRLKLSRNLAEMAQNTDGETHQEYLCKLLEAELKNREVGRMAKLVKGAGSDSMRYRFLMICPLKDLNHWISLKKRKTS